MGLKLKLKIDLYNCLRQIPRDNLSEQEFNIFWELANDQELQTYFNLGLDKHNTTLDHNFI